MIKQVALVLSLAASSHAVELTPANYAEVTDGKTVFLKVRYKEKMNEILMLHTCIVIRIFPICTLT